MGCIFYGGAIIITIKDYQWSDILGANILKISLTDSLESFSFELWYLHLKELALQCQSQLGSKLHQLKLVSLLSVASTIDFVRKSSLMGAKFILKNRCRVFIGSIGSDHIVFGKEVD